MPIDILIGCDHYWDIATDHVITGEKGPTAVYTKLGWVLSGPTNLHDDDTTSVNIVTSHILKVDVMLPVEEGLDVNLKKFWELESLGIEMEVSNVLKNFNDKISFHNKLYQVSLPWKVAHPVLPDNRLLSLKRLQGLFHQLKQHPSSLKEYDLLIREQLRMGIVEAVYEQKKPSGIVHYIPHHAVVRMDKQTTKLRVVYDASA